MKKHTSGTAKPAPVAQADEAAANTDVTADAAANEGAETTDADAGETDAAGTATEQAGDDVAADEAQADEAAAEVAEVVADDAEVAEAAAPEQQDDDVEYLVEVVDVEVLDESPEAAEARADALIAEQAETVVAMAHPEGGTCDRYETDGDGNILVPILEVGEMQQHGFVIAAAAEQED